MSQQTDHRPTMRPSPGAQASDSTSDQTQHRPLVRGWKKLGFLTLGGVFFVLGALGALLPVLPATPFLLLSSFFLVRSSPRLNAALLRSRLLGPILVDWQVHGGVRSDVRVKAIVIVVIVVSLTIFFAGYSMLTSSVVVLLAVIGIAVIMWLPTARPNDP